MKIFERFREMMGYGKKKASKKAGKKMGKSAPRKKKKRMASKKF